MRVSKDTAFTKCLEKAMSTLESTQTNDRIDQSSADQNSTKMLVDMANPSDANLARNNTPGDSSAVSKDGQLNFSDVYSQSGSKSTMLNSAEHCGDGHEHGGREHSGHEHSGHAQAEREHGGNKQVEHRKCDGNNTSSNQNQGDGSSQTTGQDNTQSTSADSLGGDSSSDQQIRAELQQVTQELEKADAEIAKLVSSLGGGAGSTSGGDSSTTTGATGSTGGDNTTGTTSGAQGSVLSSMEQADPTLATTLKDASASMTSTGFDQLQTFLTNNNSSANPNLDSTLMSAAVSRAGLSSADSSALQNTEIKDMQSAQVLTYASQTDPTLYKTLTDAAPQLSKQGWNQVENNLVNNYTGDNYMDGTLMNSVLNTSNLSAADQTALTGVLQTDMPSALASDQFAAGLASSDATMSKTLTDASAAMGQSDYQKLELYVEDSYTGQASSDDTIIQNAVTQAGLSSADAAALTDVLQRDMTSGDTTSGSGSSSPSTGDGTSNSDNSSTSTGDSNTGTGQATSTTTFQVGGGTLLEPPQTTSGLVTPEGSLSGDTTAYQGTIQGTISGANDSSSSPATQGQGTGPDALQLTPASNISTMDTTTGQGFQQKYGYFEADIKLGQNSSGSRDANLWPGWFLESSAHTLNPNGAVSAEIDIMEAQTSSTNGQGDTAYNAGVHLNSSDYSNGSVPDKDQGPYSTDLPSISAGYHVYGANWQPNDKNIEFYFDGKEVGYNPVYDTTDNSPMYMILDNGNGGWSTTQPGVKGGTIDVAFVRAYQNENLVNSANDPNGTVGSVITDSNPDDSPPALTNASAGGDSTPVTWVNTFNTDFTQAADYTQDGADTTADYSPSSDPSKNPVEPTKELLSVEGTGAHNTPWYEGQWMVDQSTSAIGVKSPVSTTPGANG